MATATGPWDVKLNGRGYMLDTSQDGVFKHESVTMLRQQSDTGDRPGEQSLNPAGLWRRSQESWHDGAGQDWLDRDGSDPFRFNISVNVDVWDKYGAAPLPATTLIHSSAATNQYLAVAAGRLWASDGTTVYATGVGDLTFGGGTGTPASNVDSLTSDGTTVYAGYAPTAGPTQQGIWIAGGPASSTAFTQYVTDGQWRVLKYVKDRLMGSGFTAAAANIYNITAAGATPAALFPHPNPNWSWTDFAEGPNHIYASGYAFDKSMIYKIGVKTDGSGLEVPLPAATLPDGEVARSLTGYLGYLVIGTDKGIRFAGIDGDGNLTLGALIPTGTPVLCGEGQDRFVWYGLSQFPDNAAYGGLGRLDLSTFTGDLTPAYATDINSPSTGAVQAVATYSTTSVAASELASNPGFEVNASGWQIDPLPSYSPFTTFGRSTFLHHSGIAACRIVWPTTGIAGDATVSATVTGLTVGETYRASAWVYLDTSPPVTLRDSWSSVPESATSSSTTGVWQQLSYLFVAVGTTHHIGVENAAATLSGVVAWIDDFSVRQVVDPTPLTVYTQSGYGVVTSTTTLATTGNLTTGRISYGLPDQKTPLSVRISYDPLPDGASVDAYLASDAGALVLLGTDTTTGSTGAAYTPTATPAGDFEVQISYAGGAVTLRRVTLYADPVPDRTEMIRAPLNLQATVTSGAGPQAVDIPTVFAELLDLFRTREVVTYQEADLSWQVIVDDFDWLPDQPSPTPGYWEGTFTVVLKSVG